jgi:hypothetical protein
MFSDNACASLSNTSLLPHNPLSGDVKSCLPFVKLPPFGTQTFIKVVACTAVAEFYIYSDRSCRSALTPNVSRIPSNICLPSAFIIPSSASLRFDCAYTPPLPPPGQHVVTQVFLYSDTQCGSLVVNTSIYPVNPLVAASDACTPVNVGGVIVAYAQPLLPTMIPCTNVTM